MEEETWFSKGKQVNHISSAKIPRQKQVTEDSFKQVLVICMISLIPNQWHRIKGISTKS